MLEGKLCTKGTCPSEDIRASESPVHVPKHTRQQTPRNAEKPPANETFQHHSRPLAAFRLCHPFATAYATPPATSYVSLPAGSHLCQPPALSAPPLMFIPFPHRPNKNSPLQKTGTGCERGSNNSLCLSASAPQRNRPSALQRPSISPPLFVNLSASMPWRACCRTIG